jgi:hypothetical protein
MMKSFYHKSLRGGKGRARTLDSTNLVVAHYVSLMMYEWLAHNRAGFAVLAMQTTRLNRKRRKQERANGFLGGMR